jgi:UDP-galactopyranose mutase
MATDVLIVGAGFAGMVMAERLSSVGRKVLLVDKRNHIGGNAYDYIDEHGVLVPRYGPHFFHTNSDKVFGYLSRFTAWRDAHYTARSWTHERLLSFPVNLKTFEQLLGAKSSSSTFETYLAAQRAPYGPICNARDAMISRVGIAYYKIFFEGYTRKMWGRPAEALDRSVGERIPVRLNRDDRYFTDKYQYMPAEGYTKLFERMLQASPNVKLRLNTDSNQISCTPKLLIYTGPIDEFFNYRFGPLPYRTIRFEHKYRNVDRWLPAPIVVHPNDFPYTRISEPKQVTGQNVRGTTVVYEFPSEAGPQDEPYYPVPCAEANHLYQRYARLAEEEAPNVVFIGRLATYKYLDMHMVVAQALHAFEALHEFEAHQAR